MKYKIELLLIAFVVAILSACSNPVQLSTPIMVSLPTSETIWKDGSEFLVQWTGGNTDSVFIQLLKSGACIDTLAITTPNSGEFILSNGLQWIYGEDYQIRVNDFSTESGTSNEFSIWAIVVTEPNFSTVWEWEQTNTEVEWLPCPGSTVRMEIWKEGYKVDDYCDWTDDDGSYTRSSAIPETWGEGDDYQIKMIDDLNNVGWSEEFTLTSFPVDGPVASWLFTSGNLQDLSGYGNTATNHGATTTTDRFGNEHCSYQYDGSNDWMCIDGVSDDIDQSSFTESVWFRTNDANADILLAFNPNSGNRQLSKVSSGKIGIMWESWDYGSTYVDDGDWHHLVILNDLSQNTYTVYLDSEFEFSNTMGSNYIHATDLASIGQEWDEGSTSNFFNGKIDDVRIYNRILTLTEIQILYHEGGWE